MDLAQRLREAGRSEKYVAKRSGIDLGRLRELLSGGKPTVDELRRLADALGTSISDLVAPPTAQADIAMLFRTTAPLARKAEQEVPALSREIARAMEMLRPAETRPPWLDQFARIPSASRTASRLAECFRQMFFGGDQISPLIRLPQIVGNDLGCIVLVAPARDVDGASALFANHAFIHVAPRFPPRMLFTLAHELGHLIAHSDMLGDFAHIDQEVSIPFSRRGQQAEVFANSFACELLLPQRGVGVALKTIREKLEVRSDAEVGDIEILFLARAFGVSFEVAAYRLEALGLLPSGGARSMYEHLKRHHESPEQRAEHAGLPPRPEIRFPDLSPLLVRDAVQGIREGTISAGRAAALLKLSVSQVVAANARYSTA